MVRNQVGDEELISNPLRVRGTVTGITVSDRFYGASNDGHRTSEDWIDYLHCYANRDRDRNYDEVKSTK